MNTTEPTFDAGGYPTEETLDQISHWPWADRAALFEFIEEAWEYPDYFTRNGNHYDISTGGWSGNESLIGALQKNWMIWSTCWESSRRGGHYEFEIPSTN